MFCPNCGTEENRNTQYCRSCGSDLHVVRTVIEQKDGAPGPVLLTKSEIGRTLAQKIESAQTAKDLKTIADKVLPEVEKFLESPEEKKLRRIRNGSIVTLVGFGIAVGFFVAGIFGDPEIMEIAAAGLITFCVGLALMINGYFFTVPKKGLLETNESAQGQPPELFKNTNELLMPPTAQSHFHSVTENTTRTLDEKLPVGKNDSN
ncbi:MAG: hypothetical protein OEM82_08380 [Acidobacteriota bacterium]|nr:hypothetical protein [Acidobacteriota bacterium]MDH3529879.1 hypothetical protein [Acidobacteriota bacterium]